MSLKTLKDHISNTWNLFLFKARCPLLTIISDCFTFEKNSYHPVISAICYGLERSDSLLLGFWKCYTVKELYVKGFRFKRIVAKGTILTRMFGNWMFDVYVFCSVKENLNNYVIIFPCTDVVWGIFMNVI